MTDITDTLEENSASDIVADAKAWLADIGGGQRLQTHSGNCHKWHSTCLVGKLTREIERLRTLATHATPSEGSVQGDGTLSKPLYRHPLCQDSSQKNLTEAEHDALEFAVETGRVAIHDDAILRKLLERLNHDAVPEARAAEPESSVPPGSVAAPANTHTLTDEEREAIEFFADIHSDDEPPHEFAVILGKLLERLA